LPPRPLAGLTPASDHAPNALGIALRGAGHEAGVERARRLASCFASAARLPTEILDEARDPRQATPRGCSRRTPMRRTSRHPSRASR